MTSHKRKASSSADHDASSKRVAVENEVEVMQQSEGQLSQSLPSAFPTQEPTATQILDLNFDDDAEQDDEEVHVPKEFYAPLDTKVVGIRYYNGYIRQGESVLCKRDPHNQYDPNAIRVDNVLNQQIGHIPKNVAAKLAPYMDQDELVIEATLGGPKTYFDVPINMQLYGTSDPEKRKQLETRLKADKLVKATPLNQSRRAAELQRKLQEQQARLGVEEDAGSALTFKGIGTSIGVIFQNSVDDPEKLEGFTDKKVDYLQSVTISEDDLAKMPFAPQPDTLSTKLLPYQLQGLYWLTQQENPQLPPKGSTDSVQLWQHTASGRYSNLLSTFETQQVPKLASGGILADDMGLGKTLQMISLIMTGGRGTSLIVSPVGVMSNWKEQFERHVNPEHARKVLIHHIGSKPAEGKSFEDYFSAYDVVITTYGKVTSEYQSKSGMYQMKWRRIILDEGHVIRNGRTKVSEAVCKLEAQSRWILSGTPIINGIKDLQPLVDFLGVTGGIEDPKIFTSMITRPLFNHTASAVALVRNLLRDLCLRRTKDMGFVDIRLPPKTELIHRISFTPSEKLKYDALYAEAHGLIKDIAIKKAQRKAAMSDGKSGDTKMTHVLECLLRMRQTCNHWALCKTRHEELLAILDDHDVVQLTPQNSAILQQALALWLDSQEDCPICMEAKTDVMITHCKHIFCRTCIKRSVVTQKKCPMCRAPLEMCNLLEPAIESLGIQDLGDDEVRSSKTEALLQILRATLKKSGSKVVVFSQWVAFLDIVQKNLEANNLPFTRLDGKMSVAKRDAAVHALDNDADVRILLASLAVCSVGLNLVSADTVVLADSWWAPAIEDQAVDRVHRLGQKRETTVWRIVVENSVEDRVLAVQKSKRDLISEVSTIQDNAERKKNTKEMRHADILKLLQ